MKSSQQSSHIMSSNLKHCTSSRQIEAAAFWAHSLRNGHVNVLLSVKSFTLLMYRQLSQPCRILFKALARHIHSLVMLQKMRAFHILIDNASIQDCVQYQRQITCRLHDNNLVARCMGSTLITSVHCNIWCFVTSDNYEVNVCESFYSFTFTQPSMHSDCQRSHQWQWKMRTHGELWFKP